MTDLFSNQAGSPAPATALKPPRWRAPDLPREHVCHGCAGAACFGEGALWFCTACVPAGFLPHTRTSR